MSYLGVDPQLKAYKDAEFIAVGGESVIPLKCDMETLVVKNGVFLVPRRDYYINRNNTINLSTAASAGDEYYIINISTFTFSEMVTRTEVEDMLDKNARPLFEVIWWPSRTSIPSGLIPADGQELSRGLYMDAFTGIEAGFVPLVSDADWLADPSKRASYTTGDGSTTFRVPDYNGKTSGSKSLFLRGDGESSAPAGSVQEDAIRNMTGAFTVGGGIGVAYAAGFVDGVFEKGTKEYDYSPEGVPASAKSFAMSFNASKVVPTAPENRPVNTSGVWCIRLFNGTVYAGRANAAQLATEVGKLTSEVQQLQPEVQRLSEQLAFDKWYNTSTPEFQARIGWGSGWYGQNHEMMFKETEYEIRIKGIIRRTSGVAFSRNVILLRNPEKHKLMAPYSPILISELGNNRLPYFDSLYSAGEAVWLALPDVLPEVGAWLMVELTIAKNPGGS